jgi:HD-GYP domain-containing protein (c-di-GMP phosphodiesterase class II)
MKTTTVSRDSGDEESGSFIDVHSFIESLMRTIEAKDLYTCGHSERVADYSALLAEAVSLPVKDVSEIHIAAHLHDLGKIGIPDGILLKSAKLTPPEILVIREHPFIGYSILKNINGFGEIARMVLYHHENFDGSGYPEGLASDDIPLGARIIRIADTFDAMTSSRSYRRCLSSEETMAECRRFSGTLFDPFIVDVLPALEKAFRKNPKTAS